jgi:hypothetical protein
MEERERQTETDRQTERQTERERGWQGGESIYALSFCKYKGMRYIAYGMEGEKTKQLLAD